jgi:hypothetical protein
MDGEGVAALTYITRGTYMVEGGEVG